MTNIGPIDSCSDHAAVIHAVKVAKYGAGECMTAIVMLTTKCKQDGHGIHTTTAVLNSTGNMSPRETEAVCKRLRELANALEQRFNG